MNEDIDSLNKFRVKIVIMKKSFEVEYSFYNSAEQLNAQEQSLFALAVQSSESAQAPYSKFKVGAASLLSDGCMIFGFNIENAAYPQCLCAEQVMLSNSKTKMKEKDEILMIAIYSPDSIGEEILTPCGSCRQILREQESRQESNIRLILSNSRRNIWIFNSISALLPFSFDAKNFDN